MKLLKAEKDNLLLQKKRSTENLPLLPGLPERSGNRKVHSLRNVLAAVIYGLLLSETSAP